MDKKSNSYSLSPIWQRAVVAGSIWGALEITFGSVLHNLMLPMAAGTLLALLGVLTVSAIVANNIQRGFFLRAAIICALLKSVSPSAVILPPMFGILFEGILIEVGLILLGANIFGLALGGGLALLSVLLFKAVRLYMVYGQSIIDFFKEIFSRFDISSSVIAIYFLLFAYLVLGVVGALIGYYTGKRRNTDLLNSLEYTMFDSEVKHFNVTDIFALAIHLFALISFLSLASKFSLWVDIFIATSYVATVLYLYERPRKMLKKLTLIVPILIFSFILPVFTAQHAEIFLQGVYIFTRAVFVVVALAVIGIELSRPGLKNLFNRGFFKPVYNATAMAFNALPIYLNLFSDVGKTPKSVINGIHGAIRKNVWNGIRPIIILTGGLGEGKTSYLKNLVELLNANKSVRVEGFIAKGIGEPPLRNGYLLQTIPEKEEMLLCKRIAACGLPNKSFEFDTALVEQMTVKYKNIMVDTVLAIDEVGRLELWGDVWAKLIEHHLKNTQNPLIFTVRRENLMLVVERLGLKNAIVVDIEKTPAEECSKELLRVFTSYLEHL